LVVFSFSLKRQDKNKEKKEEEVVAMRAVTPKACLVLGFLMLLTCIVSEVVARPACPCKDTRQCAPITTGPRPEVLAFMVSQDNWRDYDWNILTTVCIYSNFYLKSYPVQGRCFHDV